MCIVPTSFCYVNIWDGFALTTYQYKKIISCSKAWGDPKMCNTKNGLKGDVVSKWMP